MACFCGLLTHKTSTQLGGNSKSQSWRRHVLDFLSASPIWSETAGFTSVILQIRKNLRQTFSTMVYPEEQ